MTTKKRSHDNLVKSLTACGYCAILRYTASHFQGFVTGSPTTGNACMILFRDLARWRRQIETNGASRNCGPDHLRPLNNLGMHASEQRTHATKMKPRFSIDRPRHGSCGLFSVYDPRPMVGADESDYPLCTTFVGAAD